MPWISENFRLQADRVFWLLKKKLKKKSHELKRTWPPKLLFFFPNPINKQISLFYIRVPSSPKSAYEVRANPVCIITSHSQTNGEIWKLNFFTRFVRFDRFPVWWETRKPSHTERMEKACEEVTVILCYICCFLNSQNRLLYRAIRWRRKLQSPLFKNLPKTGFPNFPWICK